MAGPIVLFEDNHLLAAAKPPGLPVQGDASHDDSLLDQLKAYRKRNEDKPGNVFVGLVHRLDLPVSGVVIFAKTSKAASRLSEQFRTGAVRKTYLAMVESAAFPQQAGVWIDQLLEDESTGRVSVVSASRAGSKAAQTEWSVLTKRGGLALLRLHPRTGRRHQLRVQCASRKSPIVGDRKYGSGTKLEGWIALHARSIAFEHPTKRTSIEIQCELPDLWKRLGALPSGI